MIRDHEDLRAAQASLANVQQALAALRMKVEPQNPEMFRAMAQDYVNLLLELQAEIEEFVGLDRVGEGAAPLWIRIEGTAARYRHTASSVVTRNLTGLRSALHALYRHLVRKGGEADPRAEPSSSVPIELEIVTLGSGSTKLGLRLGLAPGEERALFEDPLEKGREALRTLLIASDWVAREGDVEEILQLIPDPEERTIALDHVSVLLPRKDMGIDLVEFSGEDVPDPRPIRLYESRKAFLTSRRDQMPASTRVRTSLEQQGYLRAIDLDRRAVVLRDAPGGKKIMTAYVRPELLGEALNLLGQMVQVRAHPEQKKLFLDELHSAPPETEV